MKPPPYDSLTLRAVTLEMAPLLVGGQVQKIRQPDEWTVILGVYNQRATHRLLLSAHPRQFRAHLTTREFEYPRVAPNFCMALRKYLEGGRVRAVEQVGVDRVLRIVVGTSWGDLPLIAELMGRHSNIILLDGGGAILEAIKPVGSKSSHRVVLPGRAYEPPPAATQPPGALPFPTSATFLTDYLADADDPDVALANIAERARHGVFFPTVFRDDAGNPTGAWPYPPPSVAGERGGAALSMSEALDLAYAARETNARHASLVRELTALLEREEKALAHRREDLAGIARNAERAEEWRIAGELLAANAHAVEKGATSVSLPNYYAPDMAPLDITLDEKLSPRENADAYFTRQRKARAAAERLPSQRESLNARAEALATRREQLRTADEPTLERLLAEWVSPPAPNSAGIGSGSPRIRGGEGNPFPPGVRIRRFTSDEGWPIWVGDNATGNDYLTTRASDPDDIWLHVRAAASAHGVIKTGKRPDVVPPATLRRAAELVAARSEAKASGSIPVDYTLRRYVRKPRNSAPGRVTYEREKTIFVGPDEVDRRKS